MIECETLLLLVSHTSNTSTNATSQLNNFVVTVSQRGVVFFRAQDNMSIERHDPGSTSRALALGIDDPNWRLEV
jgi:hypothetical protein